MKITGSIIFLISASVSLFSQSPKPPLLDLNAVQAGFFLLSDKFNGWNANDFLLLVNESNSDINIPLPDATVYQSTRVFENLFRLSFCFTPIHRTTAEPMRTRELRIGFSFYNQLSAANSYSLLNETVDTCFRTFNFLAVRQRFITADIGYLFKSNPDYGVSLFGGIMLGSGYSVHSLFREKYAEQYSTDGCQPELGFNVTYQLQNELKARPAFMFKAEIPSGIELRILKQFRFLIEDHVGLAWQVFDGGPNALRFQYAIGVGLKYYW